MAKIKHSDRLLLQWRTGSRNQNPPHMLEILNWGVAVGDDCIKYDTKAKGIVIKNIKQLESENYITIVKVDDIDVKDSLHWWYQSHNGESSKPLVFDENLEAGERYYGSSWVYGLLISSTETEIRYNFLFDN